MRELKSTTHLSYYTIFISTWQLSIQDLDISISTLNWTLSKIQPESTAGEISEKKQDLDIKVDMSKSWIDNCQVEMKKVYKKPISQGGNTL